MRASPFVDGLCFAECPRWHQGALWISDFYDHAVKRITPDGRSERVVEVPNQPAGLGWLPDGRLLVVSMRDRRVLRLDGRQLVEHADLSEIATFHANEMLVDGTGHAYVGNFGFDLHAALVERGIPSVIAVHPKAALVRIAPDGTVTVVARDLSFPNGMALTPDGRTLIVAETIAFRLTAFDLVDGELTNRRVWAALGSRPADGIALDAEGCVWAANPLAAECFRVDPTGQVLDVVETDAPCYGCALGGDDGHTLYVTSAPSDDPDTAARTRSGRIWTARVTVPAALPGPLRPTGSPPPPTR